MAYVLADRVAETSTTTGTGSLTLLGAKTGYRTFDDAMASSDTCHYAIEAIDSDGNPSGDWEVGLGTFTAPSTLARTTVLASSNGGSAVNLAAGTKNVFITAAAAWLLSGGVAWGDLTGTLSDQTDLQTALDAKLDDSQATANGLAILGAADYAAMRALLDLEAGTDFYSIAAANAAFQPLDADLTAIAALATNAAGRSILTLTDPNADRIAFWDDSAGSYAHLEVGSGMSITGTVITATGSGTGVWDSPSAHRMFGGL